MATDGETTPLLGSLLWENRRQISSRAKFTLHPSHLVIAVSAMWRVSLYAVQSNLLVLLQYKEFLNWSPATSSIVVLLANNFPCVFAAVAGGLTDIYCSRYVMHLCGLILQLVGCVTVTAAVCVEHYVFAEEKTVTNHQRPMLRGTLLSGLALLSFGAVASSGSDIALGVDQFWVRGQSVEEAKRFFPLLYWWINATGMIGVPLFSFVELNFGFHVGLIPACVIYLACVILLLVARKQLYSTLHLAHPNGIKKIFVVFREALRMWWREKREHRGSTNSPRMASFLCRAEESNKVSVSEDDVTNVRNFISMLLVLLPILFYSVLMIQTMTVFSSQGDNLGLPLLQNETYHPNHLFIPFITALVSNFTFIAIVVVIPILYSKIYPLLDTSRARWRLTFFQRMGLGMWVAVLSILCAAVVEVERRQTDRWNQTVRYNYDFSNTTRTSNVSILWQIPQYMFSGVAEAMVFLSAYEFAFVKSPMSLKGLSLGLVQSMLGAAGLLNALLMYILSSAIPDLFYGPNTPGKMHLYFFSLCGIIVLGIILFSVATYRYEFVHRRARVS